MSQDDIYDFDVGDIVEIVTPEEYRSRGKTCTDDCAIAVYAGSICEVIRTERGATRVVPIKEVLNMAPGGFILSISEYDWSDGALKLHIDDEQSRNMETVMDDIFA